MAHLRYRIDPVDLNGHRYGVTIFIPKSLTASPLRLQLPSWIPGSYMIRDFSKHLESFAARQVNSKNKSIAVKKLDSHTWEIATHGDLEVTYQVYAFDTSVRTAYLDQSRGFFNATSLCLKVLGASHLPCELELIRPQDKNVNHDWSVETTLPAGKVDRQGFGIYRADNYDALIDHPVAMGKFQVVDWTSYGTPHRMVIQGLIDPVDEKQLVKDLKAICDAHIAFFEPAKPRAPFKQYCFIVNAVGDGYGGLEHRDSTVLLCKRDDLPYQGQNLKKHSAYEDFLGLCSHEYFHSWMVKRIKPKAFDPYSLDQKNHTSLLWLFEGFTSYYDDLQLLRSGRIDFSRYLKRIEKTWNMVLRGPGRHKQSLSESSFDAWTKYYQMDENTPNAVVSYYAKGSLLALALDIKIRAHTKQKQSLDDVMRHLWDMYQLTETGMAEDDFDRAIEFVIDPSFATTWAQMKSDYVDGVKDIPLDSLLSSVGVKVNLKETLPTEHAETAKQLLGIRATAQHGWIKLTHVLDGGLAQQAGLAAGDYISSINSERVTPGRLDHLLTQLVQKLSRGQAVKSVAYRHEQEFVVTFQARSNLTSGQPKQYSITVK